MSGQFISFAFFKFKNEKYTMKMILSLLIIYFASFVVQAEFSDSDNDNYIEMLTEVEKENFISNVARRIADEVVPQFEPVGDYYKVSDEQLDTQNEYIKKLLKDERSKMRRRSNSNLDLNRKENADIVVTTIHNANRRKRDLFTTKSSAAYLENNDYDGVSVKPIYNSAPEDSDHDILVRNIKVTETTEIPMQTFQNYDETETVESQPEENTENNNKEKSKAQYDEKQINNGQNYENVDEVLKSPNTDISANTEAFNASPITETPDYDDIVTASSGTRKVNTNYGDNFSNENEKGLTEYLNENPSVNNATVKIETIPNSPTEVTNIEVATEASAFNYRLNKSHSNLAFSDNTKTKPSKTIINKTEASQTVFKGYFEPGSKTYEVHEMPPNQVPFIPIKKKEEFTTKPTKTDNNQYHYVPIYNYGLHNAVFESKHRFNSAEGQDSDKDKENKEIDLDYFYTNFKTDHPVKNDDKVESNKNNKNRLEMDYYFNRDISDYDYDSDEEEAQTPPLYFGKSMKEHLKTVRENLKKLKIFNTMDSSDISEATGSNKGSIFRENSNENEDTEETSVTDDEVTDVNSLLTVVEDMINLSNSALSRYDWLGTTVYIQTAIQKLSQVIDKIQKGYDIHPGDWDLFKYLVYIYGKCKLKREKFEEKFVENSRHVESGKELKGKANNFMVFVLARNGKNKPKKSKNKTEEILADFEDFLFDLHDSVSELHKSIKNISPKIKFKNQNWFDNLKQSYLKNPTKQQILSLLIHLFTMDLLDSIEDISLRNSNRNYVDVIKGNGEEVKKTEEIFNVLLGFLEKIKK